MVEMVVSEGDSAERRKGPGNRVMDWTRKGKQSSRTGIREGCIERRTAGGRFGLTR